MKHLLMLAAIVSVLCHSASFADGIEIPIQASYNAPHHTANTTLWFGVNTSATRCVDPTLGETYLAPVNTLCDTCMDARFVDPQGYSECMDLGMQTDIRAYINDAQVDTYKISVWPINAEHTFTWPDLNTYYSGTIRLIDAYGGTYVNVDMKSTNIVVTNMNQLLIIAESPVIVPTSVHEQYTPGRIDLFQNYPNPFNPVTKIKFETPNSGFVTLKVFDVFGREVVTLVNGYTQAGSQEVSFDASSFASGMYFYRLQAGEITRIRKMVFLK